VSSDAVHAAGTSTSSIAMSLLPVPRSPDTCHVSITSTSAAVTSASLMSGRPSATMRGPPSSSTRQPPITVWQWSTPLAKGQRPVTLYPSSTGTARPLGANVPPAIESRGPNSSPAASAGR
jgi:hypothetical protein